MRVNYSIPKIFEDAKTRSKILCLKNQNYFSDKNQFLVYAAKSISERISEITKDFQTAFEINARSNKTVSTIKKAENVGDIISSSLFLKNIKSPLHILADEELIPIRDNSVDLFYTVFGLNYINDLPGTLVQIHNSLKKDGMFIAAFLGEGTLKPLTENFAIADEKILGGIYPRIHPFYEIKTLANLIQRIGFKNIVADQEKIKKKYTNLKDLLHDIRGFGETNLIKTRRKAFTPSNIFKTIEANLKKQSPYKYQFSMPFNILFINCWKGKT